MAVKEIVKSEKEVFPPPVLGHGQVEAQLAQAVLQQRLPSAYLFSGIQGIGKASIAFRLAATLLVPKEENQTSEFDLFGDETIAATTTTLQFNENSSALGRIQQRSHPDFMLLQPEYDKKKQVFKREIVIEQVRAIANFLSKTAVEGVWKVIIIDPVDALGNAASNALLKWLEEPPPNSIFILISHAAGGLLPTIRSRCCVVNFNIPDYTIFEQVFLQEQLQISDAKFLYHITGGSIGIAKTWMLCEWQQHVSSLCALLRADPKAQPFLLSSVVDSMMKDTHFTLSHCQALLDTLLISIVRNKRGVEKTFQNNELEQTISHIAARATESFWLEVWNSHRQLYIDSEKLYLDKRNTLMQLLSQMVATR